MITDNGMDWSKIPTTAMGPSIVAEVGLNGLCNRLLSVPGGKQKMLAWTGIQLPLEMQAKMNEKMVRKAIDKNKI